MLVDSHCHLDIPELRGELPALLSRMAAAGVTHALTISTTLAGFPGVLEVARSQPNLWCTAGVHPDERRDGREASVEELVALAADPKVVAIGETGLDYFRIEGDAGWQRERFRVHVRAARACAKPLVIHTREAAADTLAILEEEGAAAVGGVMHCFTESAEVAEAAMRLSTRQERMSRPRLGFLGAAGLGLAVILSTCLRTVGYGLDYSLIPAGDWSGWTLALLLAVAVALLDWRFPAQTQESNRSLTGAVQWGSS